MNSYATSTPTVLVDDFQLLLNGKPASPELMTSVRSLTVNQEINLPSMFEITLDTGDLINGGWRWLELETIKPGLSIRVSIGTFEPVLLMEGDVAGLEPSFSNDPSFLVRGFDRLFRLQFGRKNRSFEKIRDSEVATRLIQEVGLRPRVDTTSTRYPYLLQNDQSNYTFLMSRGRLLNYELLADGNQIIFRKSAEFSAAQTTLTYPVHLWNFSPRLRVLTEGSQIEVRSWSDQQKKVLVGKTNSAKPIQKMRGRESGFELSQKAFTSSPVVMDELVSVSPSNAQTFSQAAYEMQLSQLIEADGYCRGNPKIKAGTAVKIDGLDSRFSGPYYITSATHTFDRKLGYRTKFKARRSGI